jgi:hypothetical protein
MKEIGNLEIVRYEYNGDTIEIKQIRVNDKDGKYIKFAKLKDVVNYLSEYPIIFKKLS